MKVAIFGVGRMGRRHIEVVRKLRLELVGVFDQSEESLRLASEEQRVPQELLFTDEHALFERARPECVIVATTADSHGELVCMAAKKGARYILVEKPIAVSLAQGARMIDVCNEHGAKLAVNHQMRFMPQYTESKRLVSTPAYGGLASMTVIGGNFGMAMNGTHYIEAFRYITDEEAIEVTAWFSSAAVPNPRGAQFEDRAGSIRVVTATGKRLYMEIGADQGHGLNVIYAARNGIIAIDELTGDMSTSVREPQHRDLPTTRYADL